MGVDQDLDHVGRGTLQHEIALHCDGANGITRRERSSIVDAGRRQRARTPTVPPSFTSSPLDEAIEPLTINVPAFTVVAPV
jgi:hypothetical protein